MLQDDEDCRPLPPMNLPSAPKASLEPEFDPEDVPRNPPFIAIINNLHVDINEDMIKNHYKTFKVRNMGIV